MEMPEEKIVMIAKDMALSARVFSSKRSFKYSGTERAFDSVIKRHHEDANEDHRGNRAHPIEMAGHDSVFRAGGGHADDFLRAEIGREKARPATQAGIKRPERKKSVLVRIWRFSTKPIPRTKAK